MDKLNSTGPSIETWGAPLVAGILDPAPLTTTLWDLLLSQFSIGTECFVCI